jgi:DNA polymerase
MTASEKTSLARFIHLAAGFARDGYAGPETVYAFCDDAAPQAASPAATASPHSPPLPAASAAVSVDGAPPAGAGLADSLERVAADIRACTACGLCKTRNRAAPGEGAERPAVLVIGEGPGAEEDMQGRPFVGRAGQLLDKMLASIELSRETNCFIANVVKCRPPENRAPLPDEIAACAPFLERQIRLLRPHCILCAGKVAARALLKNEEALGNLRGVFHSVFFDRPLPVLVTYHPSALLRNEALKRPAWEDLKLLRTRIADSAAEARD